MDIVAEVKKDLAELQKLGTVVTPRQMQYPDQHREEIESYYHNGMSIEEISDLVRTCA